MLEPTQTSGWFSVHRSIFQHSMLRTSAKFSRLEAWIWMLSQAAYADCRTDVAGRTIAIERGSFTHSIRFMATAWGWGPNVVARWLNRLKDDKMILIQTCSKTGTDGGTGQTVVTICNYNRYQNGEDADRYSERHSTGTAPVQHRYREVIKKQDNKEEPFPTLTEESESLGPRSKPRGTKPRGVRLPAEWVLPKAWGQWAVEKHGMAVAAVRAEGEAFHDYWCAKAGAGSTKVDWRLTWQTWIRKAVRDSSARKPRNGHHYGHFESAEAKLAAWGIGDAQPYRPEPEPRDQHPKAASGTPDLSGMQQPQKAYSLDDEVPIGDDNI